MALQVFSPAKPPLKFLYGNVGKEQMTVLETLVQSFDGKRLSRQSAGAAAAEPPKSEAEIEEVEREEAQLLLRTIDNKLAAAGIHQRSVIQMNTISVGNGWVVCRSTCL